MPDETGKTKATTTLACEYPCTTFTPSHPNVADITDDGTEVASELADEVIGEAMVCGVNVSKT